MSTRFTALTIKEGDAFLLEDNGWNCLFDSGIDGTIENLLQFKGINKLHLAICSHNDADHVNGFIHLFNSGFQIDEIWLPSFWLSILQYVQEYGVDWTEIDRHSDEINKRINKRINKKLNRELIFSRESKPISNDESQIILSNFAECSNYDFDKQIYGIVNHVIDKLELYNGTKISYDTVYSVVECVIDNLIIDNSINDINPDYVMEIVTRVINRMNLGKVQFRKNNIRKSLIDLLSEEEREYLIKPEPSVTVEKKIKKLFGNIRNLAVWAHRRKCKIKWFEPTQGCTIEGVQYSNFIALNSEEREVSRLQDNIMAFAMATCLTETNEYSLIFEYCKNGIPIIRFSADSDLTCQSRLPYPENIIVTAPHHGSSHNAIVYNDLNGDDIIWVRSDTVTGGTGNKPRPCDAFKSMKNKYCLACKSFNFISEISFEYDPWHKKWQNIRGEQCRCK